MHLVTSSCGCFTDKRAKVQGKCSIHAKNPAVCGFKKVLVQD